MRFGVVVNASYGTKGIIDAARCAEDNDLHYFFSTDHYMTPSSNAGVDAWTTIAAIAATTRSIRIGSCVTPMTFRPPAQLAKIVATVDQISSGRTILGVGAGWSRSEFLGYSQWEEDVKTRVAKAKEAFRLILALWTEDEPLNFEGKYYKSEGAILEPKPVQKPCIPLWFGTQGKSLLKFAARYADGWLPPVPGIELDEYERVMSILRNEEKNYSSRKAPVTIACNGTLSEFNSGKLEQFNQMGCGVALLVRSPKDTLIQDIATFAKDVVASFS